MFRSKRSGLIRRLWRSRLITDRDGDDGSKRSKGCRDCSCGSNPEKIPRTELWPITRSDQGTLGEACSGTLPVGSSDNGRYVMCVSEHRGAQEQHNDNKTMTCCLFREREPRPRSQTSDQGETRSCPVGEQEVKNVTYAFLKRLREKLLDLLVEAVESKGGMPSECVLVSQTELWLGGHLISPHFLLCKLYRWTDLPLTARLKALFYCQSFGMSESAMVCCNPYHYSRMCGPDSPPPPYSRLSYSNEHKPLDSDSTLFFTEAVGPPIPPVGPLIPPVGPPIPPVTPRVFTNTGTSHDSSTSESQRFHWCSVAYWEHRTRVGRLYPAHDSSLSIFYDLPQGTGLCLGQLNGNAYQDNNHRSRSHGSSGDNSRGSCVQRTRSKIGYGIVLSQEQDGVWVYNRSQHPVFAHSPTLDLPTSRGLLVKRVMPGFSLKVFDYERSSWILKHGIEPELQEGPYDPLSVRISFAKGWGPCYSRQFITSCPCWLEVLLSKQR